MTNDLACTIFLGKMQTGQEYLAALAQQGRIVSPWAADFLENYFRPSPVVRDVRLVQRLAAHFGVTAGVRLDSVLAIAENDGYMRCTGEEGPGILLHNPHWIRRNSYLGMEPIGPECSYRVALNAEKGQASLSCYKGDYVRPDQLLILRVP